MNATKLEIEWREPSQTEQPQQASFSAAAGILSRMGIRQLQKRCPRCESIVYSRRNILCGVCGHILPSACLFAPHEAQKIEQIIERDRQRYKKWVKRIAST